MKETNNNKKGYLSDIERYVRGEMSPREENSFQRRLQSDPFTDEATDGYSGITQKEAVKDLDKLEKKVRERISPKQRILYYRIAASAAALLVLASVTVLILKKRSEAQIADMFVPARNIQAFQPSQASDSVLPDETMQTNPVQDEAGIRNQQIAVTEVAEEQEADNTAGAELQSETGLLAEAGESVASLTDSEQARLASDSASKSVNADVVTGYSASNTMMASPARDAAESIEPQPDAPPQPVDGQENYAKYIRENIRRPAATESMDNAVVVVSFKVLSNGVVENISIVNTPGDEFSEEASRLIREGPAWLPAIKNGEKADDNVMLRVVFK